VFSIFQENATGGGPEVRRRRRRRAATAATATGAASASRRRRTRPATAPAMPTATRRRRRPKRRSEPAPPTSRSLVFFCVFFLNLVSRSFGSIGTSSTNGFFSSFGKPFLLCYGRRNFFPGRFLLKRGVVLVFVVGLGDPLPRTAVRQRVATGQQVLQRPVRPQPGHGPHLPGTLHRFYLVLPSFAEFYRVFVSLTSLYLVICKFPTYLTDFYWGLPSFT